jgi:iron(III) transport system ATP-binding protein
MLSRTEPSAPGPAVVDVRAIEKAFDGTPVLRDINLRAEAGAMVALLGPSGCGKTTLLRIIAGLDQPDTGTVDIGGKVVTGPDTSVAPERRRVGMVFQDWALFPHMTVARNVGYGLPRRERGGERVDRALEMVGLVGMGDRVPGTLSGGQQQRVALARAVAPEPSVLLLDEPFSNLDTSLRVQVRGEVHELLVELGITTIFVTHDQEEAFVLGDQVAVMSQGQIVQQATPAEVYAEPASPWVATFIGDANLLPGRATGTTAVTALGEIELADGHKGAVEVLLRPEELRVGNGEGSVRSAAIARVELVEFYGHDTVYVLALSDGATLRVRAGSAPRHQRGDEVPVAYVGPPTIAYPSRQIRHDEPSDPR